MEDAGPRAVRWFVGLSLVVGGFALLGGALQYGSFSGAPYWVFAFAAALAILLSLFTALLEPGPRSPTWPSGQDSGSCADSCGPGRSPSRTSSDSDRLSS